MFQNTKFAEIIGLLNINTIYKIDLDGYIIHNENISDMITDESSMIIKSIYTDVIINDLSLIMFKDLDNTVHIFSEDKVTVLYLKI